MDKLIAQLKDITGSLPVNRAEALCAEALKALRSSAERERELREALSDLAKRADSAADHVVHYSLMETPRKLPNMPTVVEISAGHIRDIAKDARSILNKHKETA